MNYRFFFPENNEMSFVVFMTEREFSNFTHRMYVHTDAIMAYGEKAEGVVPVTISNCQRPEFLYLLDWLRTYCIL